MQTFKQYEVVVVPFPFTDRDTSKRRPALILSDSFSFKIDKSILAMITSSSHQPWPLLDRVKTQKQKLAIYRDLALVSIMSLEGCRTVEMHSIKIQDIVRQGNKCGLRVSAKRSTRIVPLTDNLRSQLEKYLEVRRKVLRKKIKQEDSIFISFSNNSKGKPLSRRGIRAIIDRYLEATELKHTDRKSVV